MNFAKITIVSGFALLALAGCKQENNYPAAEETGTTAVVPVTAATVGVPVPEPTETNTVVVPVPGPTVAETVEPTTSASPAQ